MTPCNGLDKSLTDIMFMRRALSLARYGLGNVSPNPMVGAVVVDPNCRIIGEGYHRRYGEAHAEVNAFAAIDARHRHLIPQSTVYVTLEPCAHFGKTPPCARLLIENRVKRVVIGTADPFGKVDGNGIRMLVDNGIEVETGVLEAECRSLNATFFTAHTLKRPFITLKWAQSSDGFMDSARGETGAPFVFSDDAGKMAVHRLRSIHNAIAVGSGTAMADRPALDVRFWEGRNPKKFVFDRSGRIGAPTPDIEETLADMYCNQNITSVLVEGGPTLLKSFLEKGLWDFVRVEVTPESLGNRGTSPAPCMGVQPFMADTTCRNAVYYYSNNRLVDRFFIENVV